jgi:thiamine biosynthesis lipoprotein
MPITARAQDQPPALYHQKKYIMGTVFEIVVYDSSAVRANDAIEQALQEIVRLDAVMSNYKSDSELSDLNRTAHDHAQTVSSDLYRVIEESLQYSRLTGGKFDVTVGPLVDRWKAVMNGEPAPSLEEQEKLRACVGYQKIELISPDRIKFHSSCLRIDLGAIGKGYAVDRAAEILRSHGIKNALIDAGGSTWYGMGSPPEQNGWLVRLRDPSESVDPQVILHDNSVSTSEQTPPSELGNESTGHIIDPVQGSPLKTRYALSAIAKSGTASDGLSTSLLLVGPAEGKKLVSEMPDTAAVWISAEGKTEMASSGPGIFLKGRLYSDSAAIITKQENSNARREQ